MILLGLEAVNNERLVEVAAVFEDIYYIRGFVILYHHCGPVHLLKIDIVVEIGVCLKQKLLVIQNCIN